MDIKLMPFVQKDRDTMKKLFYEMCDDVIGEAHTVNQSAITGKRVYYETSGFGLLEWFAPVEESEEVE